MLIQIDEKTRITADDLQYIIQRKFPKGAWKNWRYYSRLEHLLDDLVQLNLRRSEARTLHELAVILRQLERRFSNLLQGLPDKPMNNASKGNFRPKSTKTGGDSS